MKKKLIYDQLVVKRCRSLEVVDGSGSSTERSIGCGGSAWASNHGGVSVRTDVAGGERGIVDSGTEEWSSNMCSCVASSWGEGSGDSRSIQTTVMGDNGIAVESTVAGSSGNWSTEVGSCVGSCWGKNGSGVSSESVAVGG